MRQREARTLVKVGAAASEVVPQWSKSLLLPGAFHHIFFPCAFFYLWDRSLIHKCEEILRIALAGGSSIFGSSATFPPSPPTSSCSLFPQYSVMALFLFTHKSVWTLWNHNKSGMEASGPISGQSFYLEGSLRRRLELSS